MDSKDFTQDCHILQRIGRCQISCCRSAAQKSLLPIVLLVFAIRVALRASEEKLLTQIYELFTCKRKNRVHKTTIVLPSLRTFYSLKMDNSAIRGG